MKKEKAKELINRKRRQILIHSCIYYRMNTNIIPDSTWDKWAGELERLQNKYPKIAKECDWHEAFRNFNASTGFNLPLGNSWVRSKARQLLNNPFIKEDENFEIQEKRQSESSK